MKLNDGVRDDSSAVHSLSLRFLDRFVVAQNLAEPTNVTGKYDVHLVEVSFVLERVRKISSLEVYEGHGDIDMLSHATAIGCRRTTMLLDIPGSTHPLNPFVLV